MRTHEDSHVVGLGLFRMSGVRKRRDTDVTLTSRRTAIKYLLQLLMCGVNILTLVRPIHRIDLSLCFALCLQVLREQVQRPREGCAGGLMTGEQKSDHHDMTINNRERNSMRKRLRQCLPPELFVTQ